MIQPTRRLRIRHTNHYKYDAPVERSTHRLHLRPIEEWRQSLSSFQLSVTPDVPVIEFEDVFGNWAQRFEITEPYTDLIITAESEVELRDLDPFAFARLPIRPPSWPVAWMPWERTMLAPYLTPVELPDTQLQALYDYGMEFVRRNDGDLMETLFAINLELFKNYEYVPGCTELGTTPYQVYVQRTGVCQDFANLFISLARLLGIPARYVCGYIFTGNTARPAPPPTRLTPGCSSTFPTSAGRGSTRPTAFCPRPTTSASPTAGTTATPPRRPARCTARPTRRSASRSRSRRWGCGGLS
jgi:transglutaminase-like putative cysteine protease